MMTAGLYAPQGVERVMEEQILKLGEQLFEDPFQSFLSPRGRITYIGFQKINKQTTDNT